MTIYEYLQQEQHKREKILKKAERNGDIFYWLVPKNDPDCKYPGIVVEKNGEIIADYDPISFYMEIEDAKNIEFKSI